MQGDFDISENETDFSKFDKNDSKEILGFKESVSAYDLSLFDQPIELDENDRFVINTEDVSGI